MTGINPAVMWSVQRVRTTFEAPYVGLKVGTGTGFWIDHDGVATLLSNRHNVDPSLKFPELSKMKLQKLEILLRRSVVGGFVAETKWCEVGNLENIRIAHVGDVMSIAPQFVESTEDFAPLPIPGNAIADALYLRDDVSPMDHASFIGFPGDSGIEWWDQLWNLPVARLLSIASFPHIPFTNAAIQTENVILVSGLSFSGSSGSPVFSHHKGMQTGPGLAGPFVPPKIIGIMSGHLKSGPNGVIPLSGLSYMTRSTSLLEVLRAPPT